MSDVLANVLADLDPGVTFTNVGIQYVVPEKIFILIDAGGQEVFVIKKDGTVEVNPNFTTDQATSEFWKWISTQPSILQMAVAAAKKEEREACVQEIEKQGKLWGILRSMKMTNYSNAAKDLANLLRK